jgi:prevent-host-death family protein
MTITESRKQWANVVRLAEKGTPVVITSHGRAVAAVVSMPAFNQTKQRSTQTLTELYAEWKAHRREATGTLADDLDAWRATVDPKDLAGPDPWRHVRDRSPDGGRPGNVFEPEKRRARKR